jgi:hypothetical protein
MKCTLDHSFLQYHNLDYSTSDLNWLVASPPAGKEEMVDDRKKKRFMMGRVKSASVEYVGHDQYPSIVVERMVASGEVSKMSCYSFSSPSHLQSVRLTDVVGRITPDNGTMQGVKVYPYIFRFLNPFSIESKFIPSKGIIYPQYSKVRKS